MAWMQNKIKFLMHKKYQLPPIKHYFRTHFHIKTKESRNFKICLSCLCRLSKRLFMLAIAEITFLCTFHVQSKCIFSLYNLYLLAWMFGRNTLLCRDWNEWKPYFRESLFFIQTHLELSNCIILSYSTLSIHLWELLDQTTI